ncbi:MAG: 7-cyano-7-deazaguanine synthase QueC [Planctomycetaceae bacterium]|nr:MAG: 7-cyano-7-deazaguanine synthase QueC [Planctomycetaceae bacterium]
MKTVLVYSGGLDSTVLMHQLMADGDQVLALSVDYGQRHRVELQYAQRSAERLGVQWRLADLSSVGQLLGGSSLTSPEIAVPHGHYAQQSMKQTVVANRNMIMLSVAAGWAISQRADRVAYAAHTGDHAIYPDCRPEFAEAVDRAIRLADWHEVYLYCPFVRLTKSQIVARGAELGVDFVRTWSCYEGGVIHCGRCGTCFERREAFLEAGVADPTEYEATPMYQRPE